jgi:hypothetical protein
MRGRIFPIESFCLDAKPESHRSAVNLTALVFPILVGESDGGFDVQTIEFKRMI